MGDDKGGDNNNNSNNKKATMSEERGKTTEAMDVVRDEAFALRSYRLVVIEGPNVGAELKLDIESPTRALLGTSSACHLVLADRQVSRRHAALDLHGQGVKVVDLGSTNGTRINGVRVIEAMVEPGDRISLGGTTLRLDLASAPRDGGSGSASGSASFSPSVSFGRVIGASIAMRRLYALCERLAASDLPAVIEGETGVGKELLAEALHEAGPRKAKPFIVFDCAGVRGEDVPALLFGDASTRAATSVKGASAIEQASGGTLLLDEVTELGDDAQARLIRFIDYNADKSKSDVVRVLATSRRDLDQAVQAGRFRDELFFRLAVSRIELPPLREREGDVELLARSFWKTMSGQRHEQQQHQSPNTRERAAFPPGMLEKYEHYRWPGNVRELKNVIARRIALGAFADTGTLASESSGASAVDHDVIAQVLRLDLPLVEARAKVVNEFEARYLAKVLDQHGGNVSRAAAASGIARRYFQLLRARIASDKK